MRTGSSRLARALVRMVGPCLWLGCEEPRASPAGPAREGHAQITAEPTHRERATRAVDLYVDGEVAALRSATESLCAATEREEMRARWREARVHYERVEGAIAVLFPETDVDIDARYEHVVELRADPDPLDGEGFVGMHAVERLLWADAMPVAVRTFESPLLHHAPAAPLEASQLPLFREGLCARLVRDVRAMERELGPVALDPETAWRGVLGSIEEQAEKVRLGTTGQSESRYARHTLADMRANLDGGRAVLEAFAGEIAALPDGPQRLRGLREGLARLEQAYRATPGDELPEVPEGFDPDHPREADRMTPHGRLLALLSRESDPQSAGSLASLLADTGAAMGIAELSR